MTSSIHRRAAAALATLVALPLAATLGSAPAYAEGDRFRDPADTTESRTDIRAVRVNHGDDRLVVRTRFTDLRRRGTASLRVYVDTRPGRRGPDRVLTAGIFEGTDYTLARARRWQLRGEPLNCAHRLRLDYAHDVAKVRIDRACLGGADPVRVAVKMTDDAGSDGTAVDWLGGWREFTPWLAAG